MVMMGITKLCILIVVAFKLLNEIGCSETIVRVTNSKHPGQCYQEETNSTHDPGESWFSKLDCTKSVCVQWEEHFYIRTQRCMIEMALPTKVCVTFVNYPTENYPNCCPVRICHKQTTCDPKNTSEVQARIWSLQKLDNLI